MAPIPTQIVYSGRDNTLDWQLIEDDGPLAPDRALAINRAQLITDAIVIDSTATSVDSVFATVMESVTARFGA